MNLILAGEGRDPSHTRQSPRTLAAFRPWGSWQDKRRARGLPTSLASHADSWCGDALRRYSIRGRTDPPKSVGLPTEDSPSGLGRTLGKRVGGNPSRVRISHPPPSDLRLTPMPPSVEGRLAAGGQLHQLRLLAGTASMSVLLTGSVPPGGSREPTREGGDEVAEFVWLLYGERPVEGGEQRGQPVEPLGVQLDAEPAFGLRVSASRVGQLLHDRDAGGNGAADLPIVPWILRVTACRY